MSWINERKRQKSVERKREKEGREGGERQKSGEEKWKTKRYQCVQSWPAEQIYGTQTRDGTYNNLSGTPTI